MLLRKVLLTAFVSLGAMGGPVLANNTVFVTNVTSDGNFGGISGVDQTCQTSAAGAGLLGTYRAWISGTTTNPSSRLIHSVSPYQLVNGTIIANNWTDLTDGTLNSPINLSETGVNLSNANVTTVWTATNADSTYFGGNCNATGTQPDWSSSIGRSLAGVLTATDSSWTAAFVSPCSQTNRLYCVQQVANPSAAAVSVSGRISDAAGTAVRGARVTLANSDGHVRTAISNAFGYYRFEEVASGVTYVAGVTAKRHTFTSRLVTVDDSLSDLDFSSL